MDPETIDLARGFAAALDHDDFETARALLDDDCEYFLGDAIIRGPENIIESYHEASVWARKNLQEVEYTSRLVEIDPPHYTIEFLDLIRQSGTEHEHRCQQIISFGAKRAITRIMHIELPGEKLRLSTFLEKHGIRKRLDQIDGDPKHG